MHHLKASNLLTHHLAGDLESRRVEEVEEHLAHCAECAEWVATYSWFSQALGEHPPSLEIASFALEPEALDSPTSERCAEHLERCRECRNEVELVREAAVAARPAAEPVRQRTWGRLAPRWAAAAALAATVVLTLGVILDSRSAHRPPAEYVLAGSTLSTDQTILAAHSIVVEATTCSWTRPGCR